MNETTIASITGIVLSLLFSYIPGLKDKYSTLSSDYKRLVMLIALFTTTLGIFGASCAGYSYSITCDVVGAKELVSLFVAATIANQATYALTPGITPRG